MALFKLGNTHLPHRKKTACVASVRLGKKDIVVNIPMSMHIGAECTPLVKAGDSVYVGTIIGDSNAAVGAPVHSSVSGKVTGIGSILSINGRNVTTVTIESDGLFTKDPSLSPVKADSSNMPYPSTMTPSTGTCSPALTTTKSPTATSSIDTETSFPSRNTVAVCGANLINPSIAEVVFPRARASKNFPTVIKVKIMAAVINRIEQIFSFTVQFAKRLPVTCLTDHDLVGRTDCGGAVSVFQ